MSVQVTPRGLWARGQVIVSVPGGWEWMLEDVWPVLMARGMLAARSWLVVVDLPRPAAAAAGAPAPMARPDARPAGSPTR